jgi:hypothetical protein
VSTQAHPPAPVPADLGNVVLETKLVSRQKKDLVLTSLQRRANTFLAVHGVDAPGKGMGSRWIRGARELRRDARGHCPNQGVNSSAAARTSETIACTSPSVVR